MQPLRTLSDLGNRQESVNIAQWRGRSTFEYLRADFGREVEQECSGEMKRQHAIPTIGTPLHLWPFVPRVYVLWSYGPAQQSSVPNHSQPLPGYPIDLNTSATRVLNGLGARPQLVISGALEHMLFCRMPYLVSWKLGEVRCNFGFVLAASRGCSTSTWYVFGPVLDRDMHLRVVGCCTTGRGLCLAWTIQSIEAHQPGALAVLI